MNKEYKLTVRYFYRSGNGYTETFTFRTKEQIKKIMERYSEDMFDGLYANVEFYLEEMNLR